MIVEDTSDSFMIFPMTSRLIEGAIDVKDQVDRSYRLGLIN